MTFAQRYERSSVFTRKPGRQGTSPRIGPEAQPSAANAETRSFAAPVGGLMLDVDIASIPQGGSFLMRNVYALADRIRMRGGAEQRNTGLGGEVTAIAVYETGAARKAFGFTATSAFDITAIGAVGAAALTGLSAAVWNFSMFTTSGGTYLVACGAGNTRRLYDGTTWATAPAITGVSPSTFAASWTHANRLFFAQSGTTDAWYLPVDSIGGAAQKFPLGGEFQDGGKILTGGILSADAGDNPRTTCVFVSTEGDVVTYEGADPATWTKRGSYRVPRPCGVNCLYRSGGDLLIMTEAGLFALSQVFETDQAQVMAKQVSKGVRPLWRNAASASTRERWQMIRRDREGMAIVVPVTAGQGAASLFVTNAETGAWTTWDGWRPTCMAQFGDELIFGTSTGGIGRGESGGNDFGTSYTTIAATPFFSADGRNIHARMARAAVRSIETCSPRVTIMADYDPTEPLAPPVCVSSGGSLWNAALWNVAQWSGNKQSRLEWQAVTGSSAALALAVMYTFSQTANPSVELTRFDFIFQTGGPMT